MDINCNIVSVLPYEYDQVMKVEETEETDEAEMANYRPICYYVMNNGAVEEQNAFFERPDEGIKNHLETILKGQSGRYWGQQDPNGWWGGS